MSLQTCAETEPSFAVVWSKCATQLMRCTRCGAACSTIVRPELEKSSGGSISGGNSRNCSRIERQTADALGVRTVTFGAAGAEQSRHFP